MSFFVKKNETELDLIMSPEVLMKSAPDYYAPRFEAIKDLRAADDGSLHKGSEFRRVASFVNVPLFMANKMIDPEFMKDKRKFYAFIDKHPAYVSYDRRNRGRGTHADELKLPLSALGLDVPGARLDVKEVAIEPDADVVPDSAEGTVGE